MNADPSTTAFMALRLRLRQYASRVLCSEAEADDAVQELFLRTWRKIPAKGEAAYLFASLRNICVDSLRRRTLAARHDADPGQPQHESDTLEDREIIERIGTFVRQRLSGNVRKVFEMHVYEQLDYDEIAARTGSTPEAVRTAMSRARKAIREYVRIL
ncbi:MAG: RNA polymerase sigma factor [Muribaculaceae bacterium]|nr:RNA polymerase sigma factor [Muribaculaceae bacterium]